MGDAPKAADRIRAMIAETEAWKRQHKANRDGISAAACNIRLVALRDINELERQVSHYDFEDNQYVRIVATVGVDTEEALDMAETMIALKRKELARKKARAVETAETSTRLDIAP